MNQTAANLSIKGDHFFLEVYLDPINKRIRIDDYRGNLYLLIQKAEELVRQHQTEKLIVKVRSEHLVPFFAHGFQPEAVVDGYFQGSDAYYFVKYYTAERRKNDHWITEDAIINNIFKSSLVHSQLPPADDYLLTKADESHAVELAALYHQVFQIYPTPLHDSEYVKKTMKDGTIYYVFLFQGKMVSAASAEMNHFYKNAELTDCATLPEHRTFGLMKILLQQLEAELKQNGIFCAYSIARSLSFGMNAVLFQLGYQYRGRLMNNCYIYDKLENMNMWVKELASC